MQNTKIIQGRFVSTSLPVTISMPMGVDWMEVYNYSQWGLAGSSAFPGLKYYWQRGMAAGTGLMEYKSTQTMTAAQMAFGGFTLIDNTQEPNGAITTIASNISVSSASPRVVSITTSSNAIGAALYASLVGLDQVRIANLTGATAALSGPLLSSKIWTFDGLAYNGTTGVSFNLSDTKTGANTGTLTSVSGSIVPVKWSPYWYPRVYNIYNVVANTTDNTLADVYTTVKPVFQLGQSIRFNIPQNTPFGTTWGMRPLNGLVGNVVAVPVSAATGWKFTVDIDVSAMGTFTQPGDALMPLTASPQWSTVTPIGDVASQILDTSGVPIPTNKFDEAEFNQGFTGMILGIGGTAAGQIASPPAINITGPAGVEGNIMYWKAGGSFSNQIGLFGTPPFPPLGS